MQFNFFSSFFQGQNPEGGNGQDGDFMSEAKDWAGELISGQTGTGRILVSQIRKKKRQKLAYLSSKSILSD